MAAEAYEFLRVQHVREHVNSQWSLVRTDQGEGVGMVLRRLLSLAPPCRR
jgi:hypothetical protein